MSRRPLKKNKGEGRAYYYRMRTPEKRLKTHATAAAAFAGLCVAGLFVTVVYTLFFRTSPDFSDPLLPVAERQPPADGDTLPVTSQPPRDTVQQRQAPQTGSVADAMGVISDCGDCPAVVVIPPGRFVMGLRQQDFEREKVPTMHAPNELPLHGVTLQNPFALGRSEVTRGQFTAFAEDTGYEPEGCRILDRTTGQWRDEPDRSWRDPGFDQTDNDPVVCVNWDDATQYVEWLSTVTGQRYRLPTETEWEYAARAGTNISRYWGTDRDAACTHANIAGTEVAQSHTWRNAVALFDCNDGHVYTAPIQSFTPNPFGLYDILGNVREWTDDCWNENYRGAPIDGAAWQAGNCNRRVLRGGSWDDAASSVRAARRFNQPLQQRRADQGFRVARDVNITGGS